MIVDFLYGTNGVPKNEIISLGSSNNGNLDEIQLNFES